MAMETFSLMWDQKTEMKFTLFPKFPTELRWAIYEYAVPSPDMLIVEAENTMTNYGNKNISFKFRIVEMLPNCTALLVVCKESRQVHQRMCSATLPGPENGQWIRYNPNDTTIYISNFLCSFIADPTIRKASKKRWKLQTWAKDIRKLGVPNRCFEILYEGRQTYLGKLGSLMDVFENLEEWIMFYDEFRGAFCGPAVLRRYAMDERSGKALIRKQEKMVGII
ncbi:hypothetical protein N431DRAFT_561637 [Stipitochalara longipes BDJ]|nr:hypothetical protein N431DRAFT_561637 [Stipitochalara longipes BDJ]